VRKMPTIAVHTPPRWQPPPVWPPPPQVPAASHPLVYHQRASKVLVWVMVLSSLVPMVIIAVVVAVGSLASRASVRSGTPSPRSPPTPVRTQATATRAATAVALKSAAPIVCSGQQRVRLSKRAIRAKSGPAVTATGSCQVTLDGCELSGSPAIVASDKARVLVRGGAVESSGPLAIAATGSAVVDLRRGTRLQGGVVATGKAKVNRSTTESRKAPDSRRNL